MDPLLHETPLSARLLVLTLGGDTPLTSYGANCLVLAGRDGTLLVDPLIAPAHARLVAEAAARRGFPPVTHVAVTHHHTNHALGAGWFAARGATVVAHRRCATAMAEQHPSLVAARLRAPELTALFAEAEPHAFGLRAAGPLTSRLAPVPVGCRRCGHPNRGTACWCVERRIRPWPMWLSACRP